jgi:hypothetical protein
MWEVAIRCEGRNHLTIALWGRSHAATDYWDGNWVRTSVEVEVGGFRGSVDGDVRTDELVRFHQQLAHLQQTLWGTAEFATMEGWLSIRAEGDGCGHLTFRCAIYDEPGVGNALHCTLTTDQTFTRNTVAELEKAIEALPVIGTP